MTDRTQIPEDYPGTASGERGEPVTKLDVRPLDNDEHLLMIWTTERDHPLQLELTPTQVRQWEAEFDIHRHRVDMLLEGPPALGDTVLISTIGSSFHAPDVEHCAAVNAYDTAIEHEATVQEAVEDGYCPCRHCYDVPEGWSSDALREAVRWDLDWPPEEGESDA